jgi:xanthine phosphoribosyltransferase
MPERHLSWGEIEAVAERLAGLLAAAGPWRGIVAIARGGLIPATILSRHLDLRLVDTFCIRGYAGRERRDPQVLKVPDLALADGGAGWLAVDDLVDEGGTAERVRRLLPAVHLAVLFAKPLGRPRADTYVEEVSQDTWLVFPWERMGG